MDISYIDQYEQKLHSSLWQFLQSKKVVDAMEPDATDFETVWQQVCTSYLPDGVREFEGYATVSVGWMMYVGMAIAKQWDADWDACRKQADIYTALRDVRGYDCMDEYISEDVLRLKPNECKDLAKLIGSCAQMGVHSLQREQFEPGSPLAFHAYVRTLHQMYLMGVAVQLLKMGYKMTKIG
ncbi:MAG: hypothetical protein MJZ00_05645 [Paludibacteraceae bacterium]|nr:hypothetical protein [Paludibacteraceae bacterium]